MTNQRTIKWGILSTANIGVEKVIPGLKKSQWCDVTAISSRNLEKAQMAASKLEIGQFYGSYEELLADPEVEAIYNPLPNHLHVPWSIKALEAGKHVLCEKPIGLSSEEGMALVEAGKKHPELKLMEAFMYRHHPQWKKAKEIVKTGGIGELRTIHTFFSYFNNDSEDIRNLPGIGGGGLLDIGCYPISLSRFIFDEEPQKVLGVVENDPSFGVDRLTSSIMQFSKGTSTFTCSTQLADYQRVNILGTTGRIEIEIPFNAPPDRPCKMSHETENETKDYAFEICDQYTIQGDLFAKAIIDNTPVPTPIEDALLNMKTIEAIFQSAESGTWKSVDHYQES
jgi:predicted dehydrogenase